MHVCVCIACVTQLPISELTHLCPPMANLYERKKSFYNLSNYQRRIAKFMGIVTSITVFNQLPDLYCPVLSYDMLYNPILLSERGNGGTVGRKHRRKDKIECGVLQ